jgi:hypothetical protein
MEKTKFSYTHIVPLTRELWYERLEKNIKVGLAWPGETYEEYLHEVYIHSWHPYPPGPGDFE